MSVYMEYKDILKLANSVARINAYKAKLQAHLEASEKVKCPWVHVKGDRNV